MDTPGRPERIAYNEARVREINERLRAGLAGLAGDDELHGFVCECGHTDCDRTVRATFAEYEGVRRDALRFLLVPGHEIPDVEDVIERRDRYVVTRKHQDTAHIARATDPRG